MASPPVNGLPAGPGGGAPSGPGAAAQGLFNQQDIKSEAVVRGLNRNLLAFSRIDVVIRRRFQFCARFSHH